MENRADETLVELQALIEGGLAPYHPSVQLVYLALWVRSRIDPRIFGTSSDGTCSVTQEALSRDLGLGRRTVQRALQALEVHRLVETIATGGGRSPAAYRLLLPQAARQAIRKRVLATDPGVHGREEFGEAIGGSWLDRLTNEDRVLLETLIDSLAEPERGELEQEALQSLRALAVEPTPERLSAEFARLVMTHYFGPERAGKYGGWSN